MLGDPIQTYVMSHALASAARIAVNSAGNVIPADPLVKAFCYKLVDSQLPFLGKKAKIQATQRCVKAANQLAKVGKRVTVKAIKNLIPDIFATPISPSTQMGGDRNANKLPKYGRISQSSTSAGGVALGGSTTYAPVAVSRNINRRNNPRVSSRNGGMFIAHSEMLGAILSGTPTSDVTAFRSIGFRANPGMSSVFPWLSTLAVNFEKYKFSRLTFTLVPLVSTSFNGRIGVGFDFDSSDVPPGSRQEFYSLSTHCENMPWQACAVNVKCDNILRFTGTHVAADNKLIDLGQVVVMSDAISGGTIAAAIPLYDLIVDYEVELYEPQQALFATQSFASSTPLTTGVAVGTGADVTKVSGPTVVTSIVPTSTTVLTITLPAGAYQITWFMNWSSGSPVITPTAPVAGSGSKFTFFNPATTGEGIGYVTNNTEFTVLLTVAASTWNSLLNKFNFTASRITSQVFTNYVS